MYLKVETLRISELLSFSNSISYKSPLKMVDVRVFYNKNIKKQIKYQFKFVRSYFIRYIPK